MDIERIVPDTSEWISYYANHIFRYSFAGDVVTKPESILDIACGVGYGSKFLEDRFQNSKITGVDKSKTAINVAEHHFGGSRIHYVLSDAYNLPENVLSSEYDLITCFETIEHLKNPKGFLIRMKQLLSVQGKMVISTPNIFVSQNYNRNHWKHHEKEYSPHEFVELLHTSGFLNVKLFGQEYTAIGQLRNDIRHEFNVIRSNFFFRIGKWIQKTVRGRSFSPPLPEKEEDMVINSYIDSNEIDRLGTAGPFVLLAVVEK